MKRMIRANSKVMIDLQDVLMEIADKYNTSHPVSGNWDTETETEMRDIAESLNISEDSAKCLMINELGFGEEDF